MTTFWALLGDDPEMFGRRIKLGAASTGCRGTMTMFCLDALAVLILGIIRMVLVGYSGEAVTCPK